MPQSAIISPVIPLQEQVPALRWRAPALRRPQGTANVAKCPPTTHHPFTCRSLSPCPLTLPSHLALSLQKRPSNAADAKPGAANAVHRSPACFS